MEQVYSTPENYKEAGERDLHIIGTRFRGPAIDFWMQGDAFEKGFDLIDWTKGGTSGLKKEAL